MSIFDKPAALREPPKPATARFTLGEPVTSKVTPYRQLPPECWRTVIDIGNETVEVDWPVLGSAAGPKALPMLPDEIQSRVDRR